MFFICIDISGVSVHYCSTITIMIFMIIPRHFREAMDVHFSPSAVDELLVLSVLSPATFPTIFGRGLTFRARVWSSPPRFTDPFLRGRLLLLGAARIFVTFGRDRVGESEPCLLTEPASPWDDEGLGDPNEEMLGAWNWAETDSRNPEWWNSLVGLSWKARIRRHVNA